MTDCLWIVKILLVPSDIILWVTGMLYYITRQFIYFLKRLWGQTFKHL